MEKFEPYFRVGEWVRVFTDMICGFGFVSFFNPVFFLFFVFLMQSANPISFSQSYLSNMFSISRIYHASVLPIPAQKRRLHGRGLVLNYIIHLVVTHYQNSEGIIHESGLTPQMMPRAVKPSAQLLESHLCELLRCLDTSLAEMVRIALAVRSKWKCI